MAVYADSRSPRSYDATATIQVQSSVQQAPVLFVRRSKPEDTPQKATANLEAVILGDSLAEAQRILHKRHPHTELRGAPIAIPAGPDLVKLGVQTDDPVAAAQIANALATAVVNHTRRTEVRSINRLMRADRRRQDAVFKGATKDKGLALQLNANRLREAAMRIERDSSTGAGLVTPATVPTSPAFRPGRRIFPLFVTGLSLALIAAFLLDTFDRRPKDPRRLAAASGLPLLGIVPRIGRRGGKIDEAFQGLRSAVGGLGEPPPRVVAVVSPERSEGKSTVAVGLAEAAAAAGLRACVVEADLRHPVLAERLRLDGPGLGGVLREQASLEDALRSVPVAAGDGAAIDVLPSGTHVARPGELLPTARMEALLEHLVAGHDLVLVDCPALSSGADASQLALRADAVLVCARGGFTPVEDLQAAHAGLGRGGTQLVQLVVSDVPARALSGSLATEPRSIRRLRRRWATSVSSARQGA